MKRTLAALAVALTAAVGLAAPAHADTTTLPYGATATLTIPDVVLPATGGCIQHYGSLTVTHYDDWDIDITANGPSTWPASDYLYGTGSQSRIVSLQLCPSFDQPGLYTASGLMSVYSGYNKLEGLVSDQFTISRPAPPVATPPPPPPAPVYAPVTGKVTHKLVNNGVRFTFRTNATPAGSVTGSHLKWQVKYDGRTRTISQGPAEVKPLTVKFQRGRHVVKVFRNGEQVKKVTVRA